MSEQRYQAVLAVISDGLSVSQVASKVGVSRQTVHAWLARYEAEGLEGWRIGRIGRCRVRIRCRPWWRRRCWSCVARGRIGVRGGWCSSWVAGGRAGSVGIGGVSGVGAGGDDRSGDAGSAVAEVETLGTRRPDGVVADGCRRWLPAG